MQQKNHSRFRYQSIIVFIFIFLTCLLSAAPFLNVSSANKTAIDASCLPHQDHNTDQEESNHPKKALDEQQDFHVTARNKQKLSIQLNGVNQNECRFATDRDTCNLYLADTYLLIRPHYYIFLSLYHLF